MIKQSPNKQCSSDPIPKWLLKECLDSLLPVLTLLVNKPLQTGYFPEEWKNALVKPFLKKLSLELVFPSSDQWVTCHLSLNLLKRHKLTNWVTIWRKYDFYCRANQLIDHYRAQKQHFWRYNLIFYWAWMIRKALSLSCLTSVQHSTQLTTVSYWKP